LLENFCLRIEQYLEHMNRSLDKAKVNVVLMFLMGTMKIWWRNHEKYLAIGRTMEKIKIWAEMKVSLKA
jgi:hypothetical protein